MCPGTVFRKILKFQNFCFGFRFWKLVLTWQILTSYDSVRTLVHDSTCFYFSDGIDTWHISSSQGSQGLFFGNFLFRFSTLKTCLDLIFLLLLTFVHLIRRSSACSDKHRESGRVLEQRKATGMTAQTWMKINKTKTSKYMSRFVWISRTKDNDTFKFHTLIIMKTTFYINMQILKWTITS